MADFSNGLSVNGPLTISDETTASVHFGAVVKVVIDDTSKHSDGGAWRKRTQATSWYTEALGGEVWIGQQATIAAAWTAAQSLPGAVFQATATAGPLTSGKFYVATSSTTATEVFRGISRDYPDSVLWVAETGRVIGYDLTQPGSPMWMVFASVVPTHSSLAVRDGTVFVSSVSSGVLEIVFGADQYKLRIRANGSTKFGPNPISTRNAAWTSTGTTSALEAIVSQAVNDVAITVLDTAPTDPATGLPVPTIAVFTAGGISAIKDTGSVVNSALTSNFASGSIDERGNLLSSNPSDLGFYAFGSIANLGASFSVVDAYTSGTIPRIPTGSKPFTAGSSTTALPGSSAFANGGVVLIRRNPVSKVNSMIAQATLTYQTGWQVGDIHGAYLADTVAETITASGNLTPGGGTFDVDTTGWNTGSGSSTLSIVGGKLRATVQAAYKGMVTDGFTTLVGKTYQVIFDLTRNGVNVTYGAYTHPQATSGALGNVTATASATGILYPFVATTTTTYFAAYLSGGVNGDTLELDNVSIRLVEPDRSVKNKGLVINGTLTKAAVASGANLVAYSGMNTSNYLEQPFSTDLDFSTGDFCYMGWVYNAGTDHSIIHRGPIGSITGNGVVDIWTYETASQIKSAFAGVQLTLSATSNTNHFVAYVRTGGVLYGYVNGVLAGSIANTNSMTLGTSDSLYIGKGYYSTGLAGGIADRLALWRISATAPSADQIAHIYRTELPLFQANAQCTIAGTSTSVTALAYDETTDELHVGTSWGRSEFRDLLRVYSEATTTGSITTLAANEGTVVTGGTSAKVYAPAMNLRDELRRKDIARKALGRIPAFFDYTATASQTAFVAPKGFTIKALYKNGTLMREATTGTYWTRSNDGFQETATLSVGASVSDWISLMCVRS